MPEEKKKMSKKKKWLIGIGVVLVIGFIGGMGDDEEEIDEDVAEAERQEEIDRQQKEHDEKEAAKKEEKKDQEEKEAKEQAAKEEEESSNVIDVNETLSFSEYTVTLKDVEIEDGNATLNMQFQNDSWPEGLSFMQSVGLDVYQGDELLDETSDEYTTGLGSNNGIFYKHDTGIHSNLDLSYGPIEENEPIRIVFVPLLSEYDESEEITIELE